MKSYYVTLLQYYPYGPYSDDDHLNYQIQIQSNLLETMPSSPHVSPK